jgi:hypothetical protein
VAEIQGSRELGGSQGRQVAEIQGSRELGGSRVEVQKLDAPSREWRSHESIRAVHLGRTGGRDREISRTWEFTG